MLSAYNFGVAFGGDGYKDLKAEVVGSEFEAPPRPNLILPRR